MNSNKNEENSLEREFDNLIEEKIRVNHKLENSVKFKQGKEDDLYDANEDDEDEDFIQSISSKRANEFDDNTKLKTDATLSCPCCLSLIALETQKHVSYKNQYRAMFTFNTKIDKDSPIESSTKSNKKRKKNRENAIELNSDQDLVYSVSCSICSTELGVYEDKDELYHFYNTIAGY